MHINDLEIFNPHRDYISVYGNGVKTYRQLLNELYGLIDHSRITSMSKLKIFNLYFTISNLVYNYYYNFGAIDSVTNMYSVNLQASLSTFERLTITGTSTITVTNRKDEIVSSGSEIQLIY